MIKVREIWVGNIPSGLSEQSLYNLFFIYGEISKMEYYPDKVKIINIEIFVY
jgi:hypothetical protein